MNILKRQSNYWNPLKMLIKYNLLCYIIGNRIIGNYSIKEREKGKA